VLLRTLLALLTLSQLLAAALPAFAQDEFLVNDDRVDRNQWAPRAARGSTGALVVAWMDGRNMIGSVIDFDIYVMTIRDPQAIGSTVNRRLNDDVPGAVQGFPSIAASPSGTFFCVWEDGRAGQRDIYGATLDSIGLRITPNLRLNDDPGFSEQANPQVATVGTSRYLAVWGDQRQGQGEVFASMLTSSGAPIGPNFVVSADTVAGGSYQGEPALASRADGKTLVAWLDGREGGSVFGTTFDVYAQWLDADGRPIGGNFKVNSTTGPQRDTSVAVATDSTNGFVVAWIDRRNFPGDPGDVYAQRYDASGAPIGGNVRVNDDGPGREQRAVRAISLPGSVCLIWEDLRGNLGLDSNVEAATIAIDSSPPGANFRVNVAIPARQGTPGAVWDGRDAMLAVWEDGRNGAPDIYAISILPTGVRRGSETQLNDDAAGGDQRRPEVGRGPGRYLATWIDRRSGQNELFGQWVTAAGGRDGPNHRVWPDDGVTRAISSASAVAPGGSALIVAHVTRDSDAGEIRGFYYTTIGAAPTSSFWISDSLPSAQSIPSVAATTTGYAAVWLDYREGPPRIYAQEVASNGSRVGSNHAVLSVEPADPVFALDVDADPLGGYWLCYAEGAAVDQRLWIVHLGANLVADRDPAQVAPSMVGERSHPSIGAGPDGRVEIAWLGAGTGGLGQSYHQGFDHSGIPLGGVFALGPADGLEVQAAPRLSVAGETSIAAWEAQRDGNWSVWLQAFASGAGPKSGVLRVDQDVVGADQLDPSPGLDAAGRAVVIWSDGRSPSSGTDIVGRVFSFGTTDVTEPPAPPPPAPEPQPPAPPHALRVGPVSPNPFSGSLGVAVEVPREKWGRVTVKVVSVRGETVATLYDGPTAADRLLVRWDGNDGRSRKAASGVYWIVAEAGGERRALRVVQLR
jgi:hypothetical protein